MNVLKRVVMALLILDLIKRFSVRTAEVALVIRKIHRLGNLYKHLRDEQIDSMAERFWIELGPDTVAGQGQPEEVRSKAFEELRNYFHYFVRLLDGQSLLRNLQQKASMKLKLEIEEALETLREYVYHQSNKLFEYDLDTSVINAWIEAALATEKVSEPTVNVRL